MALVAGVLLAACASRAPSPDATPTTSTPRPAATADASIAPSPGADAITVSVFVHCGLDYARVVLPNGKAYRFSSSGDDPDNPPEGWGRNEQDVVVWTEQGEVYAMGPDREPRLLVFTTERQPPGTCL